MKTLVCSLSLLSVVIIPFSLSAISFPAQTSDDDDIIVSIRNVSELREKIASHPFGALADNPRWDFVGDLVAERFGTDGAPPWSDFEATLAEGFDLTLDEFFKLFPRQMSLSFYGITDLLFKKTDRVEFVLMADYRGTEEKLDELLQIQFERNADALKERIAGVKHELVKEDFIGERLFLDEVFNGSET